MVRRTAKETLNLPKKLSYTTTRYRPSQNITNTSLFTVRYDAILAHAGTVPVFQPSSILDNLQFTGTKLTGIEVRNNAFVVKASTCASGSALPAQTDDGGQFLSGMVKVCVFCNYGHLVVVQNAERKCVPCAKNSVTSMIGFTCENPPCACKPCVGRLEANSQQSSCVLKNVCTAGKYGTSPTCPMCPTGKFNTFPGARVVTDCTNCPLGRWSDSSSVAVPSSLTVCISCIAGKYSAVSGSTVPCQDCSPGTYQDTKGTIRTTTNDKERTVYSIVLFNR